MELKKILKTTNSSLLILIVVGILAVINFFSYQIFYRFDLTQGKDYSISKTSKNTAASLDDIVNIKAYFSNNLPPQYINIRQEVGDILDEYINYSNGKIKAEFIDPKDNEELERELYLLGIPQLQFNVLEKDKYQVVNGYLGLAVKYGDKTQAIPVVEDTSNLEYQITSAIKKVTSQKSAVVGFWQGNAALNSQNEISAAYKKLAEIYEVRTLDFSTEKTVPVDFNTLIIAGAKEKFNEDELKAIDLFLMRGGSLLILADGVKVDQGLIAQKNDFGLNKLLESYGIKVNNNLVLDVSSGLASFSQGFITFTTNYPFWPKVVKEGFDKNNTSVAKLESLTLPWASSLEINSDKIKDLQISYLAKTTNRAWTENENFNLNPQNIVSPGGAYSQYNLAVSLSGKFSSPYNVTSSSPGRLTVVGDSDFIKDNFLRNAPDNLLFFQNLVDSLSLGEDLINIRSKGITERPIKELSESAKSAIRYGNIFGLTVAVIIFGMSRYFLRRRRRFGDEF